MQVCVWPVIDAPAGTEIEISIGASMNPAQAPTMRDPVTFTVGTTNKINTRISGRYAAIRFAHSGPAQWKIRSFSIGVQPQGKR
jgi:hypothetical protein